MAKYLLTQPAFLPDGVYHEATPEKPLIIHLPDNILPSLTWIPLGPAAHKAMTDLRSKKVADLIAARVEAGIKPELARTVTEADITKVARIPRGAENFDDSIAAVDIEPITPISQDERNQAIFDSVVKTTQRDAPEEVTVDITGGKGKKPVRRAADQEPT